MEEKERCVIGKGEDIFIADNDRKVMFTITKKNCKIYSTNKTKNSANYEQVTSKLKKKTINSNSNFTTYQRRL